MAHYLIQRVKKYYQLYLLYSIIRIYTLNRSHIKQTEFVYGLFTVLSLNFFGVLIISIKYMFLNIMESTI